MSSKNRDTTARDTNAQGNSWDNRMYADGPAYHYSNQDGSYYYANSDGSTYYNSGTGYAHYRSPTGYDKHYFGNAAGGSKSGSAGGTQ